MSEPNYHEIDAAVCELDRQIDALQTAKRDLWKGIRDEHGKKLADQIKLAVKLNRLGSDKRLERDEIEDGAFRILSILQQPRAPRATRAHGNIEEFPPHDPETGEITDTQEQPETAEQFQAKASEDNGSITGGAGAVTGEASRLASGRTDAGEAASIDLPTNSHSQPTSSPDADKAGEPQDRNEPVSGSSATLTDDDVPAFLKKDKQKPGEKPDCLKLKDGHCRIGSNTSALCSDCNNARMKARAA